MSSAPQKALFALEHDASDLIASGMVTLNAKLSGIDDDKLVNRVVEMWGFFWDQVLPYVEGVSSLYTVFPAYRPHLSRRVRHYYLSKLNPYCRPCIASPKHTNLVHQYIKTGKGLFRVLTCPNQHRLTYERSLFNYSGTRLSILRFQC